MNVIIESLREKIASVSSFAAACEITVRELRRLVAQFDWVGIYMRQGEELVLTAWDGPEATVHVRIPVGQGTLRSPVPSRFARETFCWARAASS